MIKVSSASPDFLDLLEFNLPSHRGDVCLLLVVFEDEQGADQEEHQQDQGEAEQDREYVKYLAQFSLEPALGNIARWTLPHRPVNVGNILQIQSLTSYVMRILGYNLKEIQKYTWKLLFAP